MPTFLKKKSVLVLGSEGHSTKILIKKKKKKENSLNGVSYSLRRITQINSKQASSFHTCTEAFTFLDIPDSTACENTNWVLNLPAPE